MSLEGHVRKSTKRDRLSPPFIVADRTNTSTTGHSDMLKTLVALICAAKAFDPSVRPRCLVTGQATTGWNQINSPQYPKAAPGHMECLYILTAPKGARIVLHFDQFELMAKNNPSCQNQGLALLDPIQTKMPGQTEIFCGLQKPVPYISRGNTLYLKYESSVDVKTKGFLLKYKINEETKGPAKGPAQGQGQAKGPAAKKPALGPKTRPKNGPKPQLKSAAGKPKMAPKKPGNLRSGGKIMSRPMGHAAATGGSRTRGPNQAGPKKQMNRNQPQQRANFHNDMPVAEKQTKQLGSKTDIETKKMLKYLVIGLCGAAGVIIVIMVFRKITGKMEDGLPEPETKLPEGTLPTHVKAIMDHKAKMKAMGKEFDDSE